MSGARMGGRSAGMGGRSAGMGGRSARTGGRSRSLHARFGSGVAHGPTFGVDAARCAGLVGAKLARLCGAVFGATLAGERGSCAW
jgi:hypothetical protein